ncbi:class I SAM-dependent methyltransferase [Calothrix sp. NIES-3974]|uniref:class I SAM-dependent methyltransferase n=1 Tax=Calothrix sp. NIES-3974 TaxID=2005462 RepID=UPI000B600F29|nr:class I SAM-dependent methyltransferase [Calothrix sp. NIES-3974]BAZ06810.1 putative glycosyl transferase [Calothrix sp. NIES-3974]
MLSFPKTNSFSLENKSDSYVEERYRQFYRFFPPHTSTVLEIGCNTGRGGQTLKRMNPQLRLFGLDSVKDRLERLERLSQNIYEQCIYSLSTHIFCEDKTFDAVVVGEFIEHIYPIDVDKTLTEIFRVLKVGGRLLIITPNPLDIKKRIRGESVLDESSHMSQHFPHALRWKLKMMGFTSVKVYGSGKVTRYLGYYFPWLHIYGSYLIIADKK